jgi:ADP-ribose pyrophosphatase
LSIRTISSREVYRNKWCSVREDIIERVNDATGETTPGLFGVMDKEPGCIVIALERFAGGEEFIWLVRQFRYSAQATYFEMPQGSWEGVEVDPEELAHAELREETGLLAKRMTRLADLWIAYGAMRQLHHVFLAEELTIGEPDRDVEEQDMTVHQVSVSEFEAMLLDGRVMDNCTAAAWGVYCAWRSRPSPTFRAKSR